MYQLRNHRYRNTLIGMGVLSLGLLAYDIRASNALLVIKWVLYSVLGIK